MYKDRTCKECGGHLKPSYAAELYDFKAALFECRECMTRHLLTTEKCQELSQIDDPESWPK